MPPPVAYSDFVNQNGALVNDGGPWTFWRNDNDVNCGSESSIWCDEVGRCVSCWVYPSASLSAYTLKFQVNVSVPMNQYGNANELNYDFSYRLDWASSETTRGTPLAAKTSVGSNSYTDNFSADDYEELLHTRLTFVGDPFNHSGTTSVIKFGDQMGYVPIEIGLTFPREPGSYINYFMKGVSFRITTSPSIIAASPSTSGNPSSSTGRPSTSSTSTSSTTRLSTGSQLSSTTQSTSSSSAESGGSASTASSPNDFPPSRKNSSAAIAGGVIGAVAILSLVIILLLYRRRRQRREEQRITKLQEKYAPEMDQQRFWATPLSNQYNVTPFMVSTQSLNSSGDPFGDGNGGAGVAGPPSPEDSISPGIHNDTQLHHYRANNAHPGVNTGNNDAVNVGQTRSVARSIARTALSGTEAPPPAYTSPTVLRVNVLQSLHQLPYENPRPAAAAPSTVESDTIPTRASSSVGGAFVNADSGLSQWARENRSYVTEKLEMKLDAAGYVPSDDPDNITEEEWKCEWGVTKLELTRMRALYARTQA